MNFCSECGNKLEEGSVFCTSCGNKLEEAPQVVNNAPQTADVESPEDKKKAHILCIISLILFFAPSVVNVGLSYLINTFSTAGLYTGYSLSGLTSLVAIVLMIVARVKYPKNTFAKILMWIYIVLIILGTVAMIAVFILCYSLMASCTY